MDSEDRVKAELEIISPSLPSKFMTGSNSKSTQSYAGVFDSEVRDFCENHNDLTALDSFTCSDIPIETHFSLINFYSWPDMNTEWVDEGSERVNVVPVSPKTQLQDLTPELESSSYNPNIDYHNIKWVEPGFYDFGAYYYPRNWSTYVRDEKKPSWSIRDNSATVLAVREVLTEYKAMLAERRIPPEPKSPNQK